MIFLEIDCVLEGDDIREIGRLEDWAVLLKRDGMLVWAVVLKSALIDGWSVEGVEFTILFVIAIAEVWFSLLAIEEDWVEGETVVEVWVLMLACLAL